VFCGKIWWTPYLYLLGADLCRGRKARATAASTRGQTGNFEGLTGGWLSQSTTISTALPVLPRPHLGRPGRFIRQACIRYAVTSGCTSKSSSEESITTLSAAGTTNSRRGAAGADAPKYLTLESMAFLVHARSS
jgi:hypothetical protein